MNGCPREAAILRAVRAGADGDLSVSEHLESCSSCRETASLARRLGALALSERAQLGEPQVNATQVWWKAYLRRRRSRTDEATGALRIAELAVPLALTVVAGVAALLAMPTPWQQAVRGLLEETGATVAGAPGWALALSAAAALALAGTSAWALLHRLRPRAETTRKS
ncbi:hypothetical protein ABI59_22930 [Acidobacteria bacterium Mor1]|nr:hypothetical protein ABI59_22930 [Acidobacteria bacterium Mor1]